MGYKQRRILSIKFSSVNAEDLSKKEVGSATWIRDLILSMPSLYQLLQFALFAEVTQNSEKGEKINLEKNIK